MFFWVHSGTAFHRRPRNLRKGTKSNEQSRQQNSDHMSWMGTQSGDLFRALGNGSRIVQRAGGEQLSGSAERQQQFNSGTTPCFGILMNSGVFATNQVTAANSSPGDIILKNANFLRAGSAANNATFRLIGSTAGNLVSIDPGAQGVAFGGKFTPGSTTVASLPAAGSNGGSVMVVTDSTAVASEGQTCVGSSTNTALAFSNGSVWKCF